MKATGAQIILKLLELHGVDIVAGIPGGGILPLYDELPRFPSIRHILVRHEQAAGFIAQGIARSTGKVGVCFATSGPGAMNLLTAIADARCDSVPIVAITGQVNTNLIGTDAFQEADTFGLSFPIAKHSIMVKDASRLLDAIPQAFQIAQSGRPGPVVVDVPRDVQTAIVEFESWSSTLTRDEIKRSSLATKYAATHEEVQAAAEQMARVLAHAQRPALFVGGGCNTPETATAIGQLLEAADIAVTTSLMGLGVVPKDHVRNCGMVGMHGTPAANRAMHEADAVLVLGARFDDRATGLTREFCPNARILHVDIDRAEINKILRSDLSVVGYVEDVLPLITQSLTGMQAECFMSAASKRKWIDSLWQTQIDTNMAQLGQSKNPTGINPRQIIAELPATAKKSGLGADDLIITTDVGQHQMWAAQSYPVERPRSFLTSGSLGTMGFGLPAAIGAALANPTKKVVCITGDGSIMMNLQELATLAELDLNVTVLVFENGTLGMVRQQQQYLFGGNYSASEFIKLPDLLTIAAGFGILAFDANTDPFWGQAAFRKGPKLVRFRIAPDENVLPFVKPGQANVDAFMG